MIKSMVLVHPSMARVIPTKEIIKMIKEMDKESIFLKVGMFTKVNF